MLVNMLRKCITPTLLVEMQNITTTLEKNMTVSYNPRYALTIRPSNCVHRSFICNS